MKMRLSDFAELHRINVRTAQIHIKENYEELEEHIERRGKQGTWIDEFAQDFLLKTIQLPSKDEVYIPTARETALMNDIVALSTKLAEAERIAREYAEDVGKMRLLEAQNGEIKAERDNLKEKVAEAEKTAQKLSDELTEEKNRHISFKEYWRRRK